MILGTRIVWEEIINDVEEGDLDNKLKPHIESIKTKIVGMGLQGDIKIKTELKYLTAHEAKIQTFIKGVK